MKRFEVPVGLNPLSTVLKGGDLGLLGELHAAQQSAEAEAARWKAGARTAFRVARKNGWEEGYQAGLETAQAPLAKLASELAETVTKTRDQVGEMALAIARKVIGDLPDDAVMPGLIKTALADCGATAPVVVAISADVAKEGRAQIKAAIANATIPATLETDPALGAHECELRMGDCFIEISAERQIDTLAAALLAGGGDD